MSPGDDKRSSKRRRKDDGSSRRDDRRHKQSRSRSPTRKKHRRSESRRAKKRSKSKRRSYSSSPSTYSSLSSSRVEKKKRRKSKHSKHSKKRKHRHRDTRCSDESDIDCDDTPKQTSAMNNKSAINNDSKTETYDMKQVSTEPKQPEEPVVQSEAKGPMTQAKYLQLQSQIREVVDPATGRVRLVRGTGEIIERIVSRNEHQNLNALATRGDGDGYAREVARQAMQRRMGR